MLTGVPSTSHNTNRSSTTFALSTNRSPAPSSRTWLKVSSKNNSTQSTSCPRSSSVASRELPVTAFGARNVPKRYSRSSVLILPARPVAAFHASANATALGRWPRTPVRSARHSASLPTTASIALTGIPLHARGYGGVCKAAPTGVPSPHTVSSSESSGKLSARRRVSSMVCATGSRRYNGSATARNSSTESCRFTSTSPGSAPKSKESTELRPANDRICTDFHGVSCADAVARGDEVRPDWSGGGTPHSGRSAR